MKKVVLVTGGSRGIGFSIVKKFQELGWRVATCATPKVQPKDLEEWSKNPADLKFFCDVSKVSDVKEGVTHVISELGRIDILINNAGIAGTNSMDPLDGDDLWHQILNVNLNGTYYFCKYAGSHLPEQTGRIINIGSTLSLKGVPDATAYCAAKHGVLGLTRALAHHFAPKRITVNAVCPGWVSTEMALGRFKSIGITEKEASAGVPLGRLVHPEEVADFVSFIATSPSASMITGQALTIDGGSLA